MAQDCVPVTFEYSWVGLIDLDDELNPDWYQLWCDENTSTEPREAYLYLTLSDVLYIYQAGVELYPPETPGSITGSTLLCPGATSSFYISPVPDATEYEWTVPQGWTINSGQGDTLISVTTGQGYGSGFSLSVTAINDDGESDPSTLNNLTVSAPISITTGPSSLIRPLGSSATFSVSCSGSALQYQWQKNGDNIANATSSTYTINSVSLADEGKYRVRISNVCNSSGEISSQADLVVSEIARPDSSKNYIAVYEPGIAIRDVSLLQATSISRINVQYVDGLGRPLQDITVSHNGDLDLITPHTYDKYGRESVSYLPVPISDNGGQFVDSLVYKQAMYYDAGFDDEYGFSLTVFESSPLNRVMKQGAPGSVWQPSETANDHTVKYDYQTNSQYEVLVWKIDPQARCINSEGDTLNGREYHYANTLYKSITKDENWSSSDGLLHTTEEFRNMLNQVVLKRTYVAGSTGIDTLNTYYVYDDFGLLRYVLSPNASANLGDGTEFSRADTLIKELCYYYEYDGQKEDG